MRLNTLSNHNIATLSFADGNISWRMAKFRVKRQFQKNKQIQNHLVYDINLLANSCSQEILNFIKSNKYCGYWIWKPILIRDYFLNNPTVTHILYLDAGCELSLFEESADSWQSLIATIKSHEMMIFALTEIERDFTSSELFDLFETKQIDRESPQISATVFSLERNFGLKFCSEWLRLMSVSNFTYLTGERLDINSIHRHDQSFFSLLAKKRIYEGHDVKMMSISYLPHNTNVNPLVFPIHILRSKKPFSIITKSRIKKFIFNNLFMIVVRFRK